MCCFSFFLIPLHCTRRRFARTSDSLSSRSRSVSDPFSFTSCCWLPWMAEVTWPSKHRNDVGSHGPVLFFCSSVFESELSKHLLRCNARPKAKPVHFVLEINSGPVNEHISTSPEQEQEPVPHLSTASVEYVKALASKVNILHGKLEEAKGLRTDVCYHDALASKL
jgi:hypothetical protein